MIEWRPAGSRCPPPERGGSRVTRNVLPANGAGIGAGTTEDGVVTVSVTCECLPWVHSWCTTGRLGGVVLDEGAMLVYFCIDR